MLSNLHSLHFNKPLQNSGALPAHVYDSTTNKMLLNLSKSGATTPKNTTTLLSHIIKPRVLQQRTMQPAQKSSKKPPVTQATTSAPSNKTNSPNPGPEAPSGSPKTPPVQAVRKSRIVSVSAAPETQLKNKSSKKKRPPPPSRKSYPPPKPVSRPVNKPPPTWKPGPGVIEKVDKATGQIMHLSVD